MRIFLIILVFIFSAPSYSYEVVHHQLYTRDNNSRYQTIDNKRMLVYKKANYYDSVTDINGDTSCVLVRSDDYEVVYNEVVYSGQVKNFSDTLSQVNVSDCSASTYSYTAAFSYMTTYHYIYASYASPVAPLPPNSTVMTHSQPTILDSTGSTINSDNNPLITLSNDFGSCNVGVCCATSPDYNSIACASSLETSINSNDSSTCTMGVCCSTASEYNLDLCNSLTTELSDVPSDYVPQVDNPVTDSNPDYTLPQSTQTTDTGSIDVVNSVNALSNRMSDLLSKTPSKVDINNQTEKLSYDINKQTYSINQQLALSTNSINNQLSNQSNKITGSIIDLNNNIVSDGILTRKAINDLSSTNNQNLDLTPVTSQLQTLNSTESDSNSILSQLYDFFTQDSSIDLLPDPSSQLQSSLDSYDFDKSDYLGSQLNTMVQNFTFDTQTYSFVGTTPYTTFNFTVFGNSISIDPWPLYSLASLIGIFILIGVSILGMRIIVAG